MGCKKTEKIKTAILSEKDGNAVFFYYKKLFFLLSPRSVPLLSLRDIFPVSSWKSTPKGKARMAIFLQGLTFLFFRFVGKVCFIGESKWKKFFKPVVCTILIRL